MIVVDEFREGFPVALTALKSGKQNDSFELKQRLQSQLAGLGIHIERCNDFNILLSAQAHIDSALTIIKGKELKLPSIPANKKVVPQRSFYSTKKRSRRPLMHIAKPSFEERQALSQHLLNSLNIESANNYKKQGIINTDYLIKNAFLLFSIVNYLSL